MSKMFKYITESVLNEISAEDAYNKFYSNIPKNTFDTILNAYGGKFDAVIKFIFNNIRDYEDSFMIRDNALKFIKLYKSSENNVRMEFLKRFKEGQYEDIADAINGINEIQKEGVSTAKTRQNEGYVELFNNSKYLLSATLTYEANQHFYGHTTWCTASDRFGRYDGWYFFLAYVFDVDYVREDSVYDNLGTSKYPLKCVLVQFVDKEKNKTYQAQLFNNGAYGQICDEKDESIEKDDFLNNIMPKDFMWLLRKKINVLMELEEKCFSTEYKYQTSRNEYIELKREMKEERNRIRQSQMFKELEEEGQIKVSYVQTRFDKIKNSELLLNTEFVKQLVINSSKMKKQFSMDYTTTKELAEEYEKILKEQGYLFVSQMKKVRNSKYLYELYIRPILGHMHDIDCDSNNNLIFSNKFNFYSDPLYGSTEIKVEGYIYTIIEIEEDEVNDYEGIFQSINSYSDVDKYYANFGVKKVIATENSDIGIKAIALTTNVEFPMGIQEGYNEKLFNSILLIENKFKSKLLYSFFNTQTLSRIKYESEHYIRYVLPCGNKAFLSFYNSDALVLIDLKGLKVEEKFFSQYIDGSDYCYSLVMPETKELYFFANKLYKTGLKAISDDLRISSVMVSDRYIVFNEDRRKDIEEDCKVFDAKIGKYIVKNGKFKYHVKNMCFVHDVFDVDKNKTIPLDY